MVKIYCNRCGKQITGEHYYTINIGKVDINPKYDYSITACASSLSSIHIVEQSPYEKLSSQVMYCENCKEQIEEFIDGNDEYPWI